MGSAPVLPGTRGSDPVRVSPTCAGGSSAERLGCLAVGPCGDPCGPRGLSTRPTRGRLGTRSTNPDIVIATDKCETANIASYWSAAEMRQAEYFRAILDEQHAQIVREIADDSAALAHCQDTDDTRGVRRLRRRLAHKHRAIGRARCTRTSHR
jgi:hypothetical protein